MLIRKKGFTGVGHEGKYNVKFLGFMKNNYFFRQETAFTAGMFLCCR